MLVDPERLHAMSDKLTEQIDELAGRIRALAGDDSFNIGSPMQLSHILFDVMGLPTKGLKKTQRGYYSTNAKVLDDLARDHEIVRLILEWREKTKIKSTYLDTLGPLRAGDGRVHTTFTTRPSPRPAACLPPTQPAEHPHALRAGTHGEDGVFRR